MANAKRANVWVIDTSAALSDAKEIVGIRYIAGSGSPSVTLKADADSSGQVIYECDGASDVFNDVYIRDTKGVYVTVAGTGTIVYLYLR